MPFLFFLATYDFFNFTFYVMFLFEFTKNVKDFPRSTILFANSHRQVNSMQKARAGYCAVMRERDDRTEAPLQAQKRRRQPYNLFKNVYIDGRVVTGWTGA